MDMGQLVKGSKALPYSHTAHEQHGPSLMGPQGGRELCSHVAIGGTPIPMQAPGTTPSHSTAEIPATS